jgi:hypothetical protein
MLKTVRATQTERTSPLPHISYSSYAFDRLPVRLAVHAHPHF